MNPSVSGEAAATSSAFAIVREDLRRVDRLLRGYASLASVSSDRADRNGLIERFGAYLRTVARIEVELVYPSLEGTVATATLNEARQNHADIEAQLCGVVEGASNDERSVEGIDRGVRQLAAAARAHVAFEEAELFAAGAQADTPALAARVALRRAELLGEQGAD